ncbi:MAG: extradiol dioxygenase [Saprospiraceae bacterium]|nr:extradiol dioxygenase [Saprospiraceae bacterium]
MTKEIWINLPVQDVLRAKAFFIQLGFSLNPQYGDSEQSASLLVGEKNVVVMLFAAPVFQRFTQNELPAPHTTEVLLSISAASREEVDALAAKAVQAGGTVYAEPAESQGWMYGCGFADPDGHRWNVLYMDHSKLPPR